MIATRRLLVPVDGGDLVAAHWGGRTNVLAIHGVSASHAEWSLLAEHLPGLVAPDLRGRGDSAALPGPWGMRRHADDLARLLDATGIDRAVVVGHSMGGFVALVLAHRFPDRVERLVLVDGGLPLPSPPGVDQEQLLEAVIGPAAQRLSMTFASPEAYRDFWRKHPGIGPWWSKAVQAYVDYDLGGTPPEMRSRTSFEAVQADTIDLYTGSDGRDALESLSHPAVFLRAERGLLDEETPLYSRELVADVARRVPGLDVRDVPDSNHYTITMTDKGAAAVAAVVNG